MNAYQSKAALISEHDAEVDDVIASLDAALGPCDNDQEEDEVDYPTWIDIDFPIEVDMIHHVRGFSIPIRLILTWMASHTEDRRFLAIRDDFFDDEDDDACMISDQYQLYDREELARLRIDRRNRKAKRDAERMSLPPNQFIVNEPMSPEERWGNHLAEGLALEAELHELNAKFDELDKKWEAFVETSEDNNQTANWIEVRRSELKLEGCKLDVQFDTLMARTDDLRRSVDHP